MAPLTRICLIGPESTGKTELAKRLARELAIEWIPEFAREYAEARANQLCADDVEPIARGQIDLLERRRPGGWSGGVPPPRRRDGAGPAGEDAGVPTHVILDTDLISTVVYARHYYGACPPWIEEEARKRRADLYLLLDTDVAWQPDVARDSGGDAREDLFDAFRCVLDEFETRWEIVSGDWEERFARALELIS